MAIERRKVDLPLFFFPSECTDVGKGDGTIGPPADVCSDCATRSCAGATQDIGLAACEEEGLNFLRVHKDILFYGFLSTDWDPPHHTPLQAAKKYRRRRKKWEGESLPSAMVDYYCRALQKHLSGLEESLRSEALEDRRVSLAQGTVEEWAREAMQSQLKKMSAGIVHDIKQLVVQISQSVEFAMAARYGDGERATGRDFPGLQKSSGRQDVEIWEREKSVLFSCDLLQARINAAAMLASTPGQARAMGTYSPHRMTTKYSRIYGSKLISKDLAFHIGVFYYRCRSHQDMPDIVIQALTDNAVKYAPQGSTINVNAEVRRAGRESKMVLIFRSLGPFIPADEIEKSFQPGFRAKAARDFSREGSGLGLFQARLASEGWARLTARQSTQQDQRYPLFFETTFELEHILPFDVENKF
jgi:signal transduction histidine kinase